MFSFRLLPSRWTHQPSASIYYSSGFFSPLHHYSTFEKDLTTQSPSASFLPFRTRSRSSTVFEGTAPRWKSANSRASPRRQTLVRSNRFGPRGVIQSSNSTIARKQTPHVATHCDASTGLNCLNYVLPSETGGIQSEIPSRAIPSAVDLSSHPASGQGAMGRRRHITTPEEITSDTRRWKQTRR